MTKSEILQKYYFAKKIVIEEGYLKEILWQDSINFDTVSESDFLRELSWVILTSGMKTKVVENCFQNISKCFFNWKSSMQILLNKEKCIEEALCFFNNPRKIIAIIDAAQKIIQEGFTHIKTEIIQNPLIKLQEFAYIGPITAYHLAKNIGIPVAKPDRHLVRIANNEGYDDVQELCSDLSKLSGDSIPIIDIIFWRYATINPQYLDVFKNIRFN